MTTPASPPGASPAPRPDHATAILSALTDAGMAGHFDLRRGTVVAYPAGIPRERAIYREHAVINCKATVDGDQAWLNAATWIPDIPVGYRFTADIYQTPTGRTLTAAKEMAQCAKAVAEYFTVPRPTAGAVLFAALAEYGITPVRTDTGTSYTVPYGPGTAVADVSPSPYLSIGTRYLTVDHVPAAHSGWIVSLHQGNGEVAGNRKLPLYRAGIGGLADCIEDSAAAAAAIADFLMTHTV